MTMVKQLPDVAVAVTGALVGVKLGETPWFPGANAILSFSPTPPAGAAVILVQGSPTGVISPDSYTTVRTLTVADMKSNQIELTDLPKYLRLNVSVAGTALTATPTLVGVQ
jgi:hypothetical protein